MLPEEGGDGRGHVGVAELAFGGLCGVVVAAAGHVAGLANEAHAVIGALGDGVDHLAELVRVLLPRIIAAFF